MGHLGRTTTVHSISAQTSQEEIKFTYATVLLSNLYSMYCPLSTQLNYNSAMTALSSIKMTKSNQIKESYRIILNYMGIVYCVQINAYNILLRIKNHSISRAIYNNFVGKLVKSQQKDGFTYVYCRVIVCKTQYK